MPLSETAVPRSEQDGRNGMVGILQQNQIEMVSAWSTADFMKNVNDTAMFCPKQNAHLFRLNVSWSTWRYAFLV